MQVRRVEVGQGAVVVVVVGTFRVGTVRDEGKKEEEDPYQLILDNQIKFVESEVVLEEVVGMLTWCL